MEEYGWIVAIFLIFFAAAGGYAWYKYSEGYHNGEEDERELWESHQQDFLDSLMAIEEKGIRARERILQEMTEAAANQSCRRRPYRE